MIASCCTRLIYKQIAEQNPITKKKPESKMFSQVHLLPDGHIFNLFHCSKNFLRGLTTISFTKDFSSQKLTHFWPMLLF